MLPKVSILIPCYNAERWIAQAIQSALAQTYSNKEVIVIDDGSSDRSLEIIQSFGNEILWKTQHNQGGNITRNRLLELCSGEWLQYLDADDYLLPSKIENQMQYLTSIQDIDVLYSPSIFEYWNGENITQDVFPIPEPYDPWILLARWYLPQTGSPLWRKQAILDVGSWKDSQPCCQEHELYLRLLIAGKKFAYCDYPGSVYRQWSESTVCKKDKPETYRHRLAIKDAMEQFLIHRNELTSQRLTAINQSRFECARIIWLTDREWANRIISQIQNIEKQFSPSGRAVPFMYSFIYRWLGFEAAERIAAVKRRIPFSKSFS